MINVVPFAPEHLEGVLSVILSIQQKEFSIPITVNDQPDLLDIPGFYRTGNGNFWVALASGEVVGTVALLDIGAGQAALRKMFVRADFRGAGRGVASALLEALLAWGASHGISAIYLGTTEKFHAAHRFYEKNGFQEISVTALPSSFPIMSVDTKFYMRTMR